MCHAKLQLKFCHQRTNQRTNKQGDSGSRIKRCSAGGRTSCVMRMQLCPNGQSSGKVNFLMGKHKTQIRIVFQNYSQSVEKLLLEKLLKVKVVKSESGLWQNYRK